MEALFVKQQQPQSSQSSQQRAANQYNSRSPPVVVSELERKNTVSGQSKQQQKQQDASSALDILLQGGSQQLQRPFVQQNFMPNTEGRVYSQSANSTPRVPQPRSNQNNLDALLKILQGQNQASSQPSLIPQARNVNIQESQTAASMRPGKVVTGQRPPFMSGNLQGQGSGQGHVSGGSPEANFVVRKTSGGAQSVAIAPTPPRSVSGGGDGDVLQKLLNMNSSGQTSGQQQQQRARVVEG
eukprot:TRINITY_DN391_c0_g2_i2.p1 TRINITY_DN391_c0_g2~~TRINITY_DN391_c0_g2_i2.p1  ORF type:complete len:279 (-),score=40.64 TRINITY_DN391_c0_g2_i2:746-1468(-)